MLYALNRLAEASNVYTQLIDRNPENVSFYVELERCRGLSANGDTQPDLLQERRLALYDNIAARHPRAAAPARVPLQFVRGARFIERLKPYLINGFRKGVPAMFQQLRKCIYTDPAKIIIVEQMMLTFVKALETTTRFPDGEII
jgi:peptide alpha-N-acetyltransferase